MADHTGIRLEVLSPEDSALLGSVVDLHRTHSSKLGFFPKGAFQQHANQRSIIVALDDSNTCVGYLLYRVARGRAAIVHLCTSPSMRRQGVSRKLVEELKRKTTHLTGIILHCRRDYDANHVWSKFGFEALNSKTGRGADAEELTCWWFKHPHDDLFSLSAETEPDRQKVVIDANVFYDLQGRDSDRDIESKALLADWVQGYIQLVRTKELLNEINRGPDAQNRMANRAAAERFPLLEANDSDFTKYCDELRPLLPKSASLNDEADIRHVAYAIAGGAQFLVTRDGQLNEHSEKLYRKYGLTILHPSQLINQLDALEREEDYRPARIEGSHLKESLLEASRIEAIVEAFKRPHEKANDFRQHLRCLASLPRQYTTKVITDGSGVPILLYVTEEQAQQAVCVPMLRRTDHTFSGTLIRHVLRNFLMNAALKGKGAVAIKNDGTCPEDTTIYREFGFVECDGSWIKLVLGTVGSISEIHNALTSGMDSLPWRNVRQSVAQAVNNAIQSPDATQISIIERHLWPAKILTEDLPAFIVPILPQWAQHFFDTNMASGLLPGFLRDELHLGLEGAYYRSARNNNLSAPGRVLWYVSSAQGAGTMAIEACSQIEEVVVGRPKDLFRSFRRLGVYEWGHVYETAGKDINKEMSAFRFRMTERFKVPISVDFLSELGIKPPFLSPRQVTTDQFARIYRMGVCHSESVC